MHVNNNTMCGVGVCASIMEPVTVDILLRVIEAERWSHPQHPSHTTPQPDSRNLMPPPKKLPRIDHQS